MELLLLKFISGQILFIILLLLRELGVLRHVYEELYTHPNTREIIVIIGDIFYMVGGSIMASVVYAFVATVVGFSYGAFAFGLAFTVVGAYLRR